MDWETPYTIQRDGWFIGYSIIFDDTKILSMLSEPLAIRWATSLNAAYNLGRTAVKVEEGIPL